MVLRQPLAQRGRHQQQLLTVTLDEVLSHAQKCLKLTTADRPGVCETASAQSGRSFSLLLSHQSDAPLLEAVTHAIGRDNAIISAAHLMSVFAGAVAQTGRGSGAAASGPPLASRARSSAAGPGRGPARRQPWLGAAARSPIRARGSCAGRLAGRGESAAGACRLRRARA